MTDTDRAPDAYSRNGDNSPFREYQSLLQDILPGRVRQRAKDIGLKQSAIAEKLYSSTSSVNMYWHGKRLWPTEMLAPLSRLLGWNLDQLLIGPDIALSRNGETNPIEGWNEAGPTDSVPVGEIDLAYGLGSSYTGDPVETQVLHFPRTWIEAITSTPSSMLTIARGRGDSMQPTIQDGDMVMIDRSQRIVREQDAIWALTIGDLGMIKRIRAGGERIRILSDNERVPPDEVHHEEVNIVGRVIFIGRRL